MRPTVRYKSVHPEKEKEKEKKVLPVRTDERKSINEALSQHSKDHQGQERWLSG